MRDLQLLSMINRIGSGESSFKAVQTGRRGMAKPDGFRRIIMVGPFPPPVHGMASVNAAVFESLRRLGSDVTVIDIAASSLNRSFISRVSRVSKVISGLLQLAIECREPDPLVYMSVSGGFGQIYEILFALLARVAKADICLHHHSFSYLDSRRLITSLLCRFVGPSCVHIVLSQSMGHRLLGRYPSVRRSLTISNAVLLTAHSRVKSTPRTHLNRIGFISNISREKGVYEFLSLAVACEASGIDVEWVLAGPFQDSATETRVSRVIQDVRGVKYIGPVYGEDKEGFFASIDVLVFPSRYANEAEPLAIHEAMMRGVPVIAYGRGSIPEIVGAGAGVVIPPSEPFLGPAKEALARWIAFPNEFVEASNAAVSQFKATYDISSRNWLTLTRDIMRL